MEQHDYHISVLLHESIEALRIRPEGTYVDLTYGGGGHSKEILKHLDKGVLYAFDQDIDAYENVIDDDKLVFIGHNFRYLKRFLTYNGAVPVDGILADLGISSFQIDEGEKGFSTRFDGPLDMRMNQESSLTAQDILESYSETELIHIFSSYGEVRNSKTLAKKIVDARGRGVKFETTQMFVSFLNDAVMGHNPNKYYAQVFQALRIEVNDEMGALADMLQQAYEVLKEGGVLAIITFHSLEDRLVKNFMKTGNIEGKRITDKFGVSKKYFKLLSKKPIEASAEELKNNARSRSAKLRIAQKVVEK